jgi:hypothetical protein
MGLGGGIVFVGVTLGADVDDSASVGDGGACVAVDRGVAVDASVSLDAAVMVDAGERVRVSPCFAPPPQATNTGTVKTKARARTTNLCHGLLFGHTVDHFLLRHR